MRSITESSTEGAQLLDRLLGFTFVTLVLILVGFGAYYYWDRYVYFGDESPIKKAAAHLEDKVRQSPNDLEARYALSDFYLKSGAYEESIEQANQILSAKPEDEKGLFYLGMSYAFSGQPIEAIKPLSKFVTIREQYEMAGLDTDLERALYYLGVSYFKAGREDEAVNSLTRALEINRTDADAMFTLGMVYGSLDEHEKAIEQYQNAVRFAPNFTEAYQSMIESYNALGLFSHASYARGMEAFTLDDFESAYSYLESATTNLPDFAPAYLGLGLTQEQRGDFQEATMNLQRALELEPDNYMATYALSRIQATIQSIDS
jgi:tetratricopeptide (TPR) repeat protein